MRNAKYYNVDTPVWQPDNHVGEATFRSMLAEATGVQLFLNQTLVDGAGAVTVDNGRIQTMQTEDLNSGNRMTLTGKGEEYWGCVEHEDE